MIGRLCYNNSIRISQYVNRSASFALHRYIFHAFDVQKSLAADTFELL